jgi:hypothetical protein
VAVVVVVVVVVVVGAAVAVPAVELVVDEMSDGATVDATIDDPLVADVASPEPRSAVEHPPAASARARNVDTPRNVSLARALCGFPARITPIEPPG